MHAMKTKGWMGTVALAALLGATGCSKNEGDGGGGGGSSVAKYGVTISDSKNGAVTASAAKAETGDKVIADTQG